MPDDAPEQVLLLVRETARLLVARGFAESRVHVLSGKVTREAVLKKLNELKPLIGEEFWLVLYGHCARNASGAPAFQVSGVRLTPDDLKPALDALPGRQFVYVAAGGSGGFLPPLRDARRTILSATRGADEPDQPRFLSAWVKAFAADPGAPFVSIAAKAAAAVDAEYANSDMAQSEHARLADPISGGILDAPFGMEAKPDAAKATQN
jgi:hypothetical protein